MGQWVKWVTISDGSHGSWVTVCWPMTHYHSQHMCSFYGVTKWVLVIPASSAEYGRHFGAFITAQHHYSTTEQHVSWNCTSSINCTWGFQKQTAETNCTCANNMHGFGFDLSDCMQSRPTCYNHRKCNTVAQYILCYVVTVDFIYILFFGDLTV